MVEFVCGNYPTKQVDNFKVDAWSKGQDSLSPGTIDLFIISHDGTRVLLNKRNVHPQKSWWLAVGGRHVGHSSIGDFIDKLFEEELKEFTKHQDSKPLKERMVNLEGIDNWKWQHGFGEESAEGKSNLTNCYGFQLTEWEQRRLDDQFFRRHHQGHDVLFKTKRGKTTGENELGEQVHWFPLTNLANPAATFKEPDGSENGFHPALTYLALQWCRAVVAAAITGNDVQRVGPILKRIVEHIPHAVVDPATLDLASDILFREITTRAYFVQGSVAVLKKTHDAFGQLQLSPIPKSLFPYMHRKHLVDPHATNQQSANISGLKRLRAKTLVKRIIRSNVSPDEPPRHELALLHRVSGYWLATADCVVIHCEEYSHAAHPAYVAHHDQDDAHDQHHAHYQDLDPPDAADVVPTPLCPPPPPPIHRQG